VGKLGDVVWWWSAAIVIIACTVVLLWQAGLPCGPLIRSPHQSYLCVTQLFAGALVPVVLIVSCVFVACVVLRTVLVVANTRIRRREASATRF